MFKPIVHHFGLDSSKPIKHHEKLDNKTYYWIVAENPERRVIYGYKSSVQEAELFKAKINDASAEIVPLPTKSANAARELLRGRTLDNTGSINESFKKNKWKAYGE